ncbi:Endogenous retrovirus group 3 member 1 Env polyprotein [Nibea albiflora]|uniref:Endogenous retrovirus group 3 member 1 Env polyprotein n=1 Tax=Nibea albiflora TaxID=240163 RepID=A0ACB7EG69_NIBAL|nr:Endogenous retrovirus group 3 member 1 Env polyprotein [Nibea albiflora]
MMKARENMQLTLRCMKISKIEVPKGGLSRLWKTLMRMTILLMVMVMIMLMMDKGKDLEISNSNMSQRHLSVVNHQKSPRDLIPEVKLDKEVPGQAGGGENPSDMKAESVGNAPQLITKAPNKVSITPKPEVTVIRAMLGETTVLPCKCGKWNGHTDFRLKWIDSRRKEVELVLPGNPSLGGTERKYMLHNEIRYKKIVGDCSLVVSNLRWEDEGEYMCSYREPEFKSVTSSHSRTEDYITRKVRTVIIDLRPVEVTTIGIDNKPSETILNLGTTMTVNVPDQVINLMTTLTPRMLVEVTQRYAKIFLKKEEIMTISKSSEVITTDTKRNFVDLDHTSEEMLQQYHALQKRETKWKAYGFDASTLGIADPWASKNLWFQRLTHSVRSVKKLNAACLLKVPSPGTWDSILEAVPEPLSNACQMSALKWLWYQQEAPRDRLIATLTGLFRPRSDCSWLRNLYINLLDHHENVRTAVPDAMEVRAVKAKGCFCSNEVNKGSAMFMGISDCDRYLMDLGQHGSKEKDKLHEVTFQVSKREPSRTLMVEHHVLPGNVTIGNFKDIWWICGGNAYLFLPYGWSGCCYMATLKLPYEAFVIRTEKGHDEMQSNDTLGTRVKRELAQFHNLESYHWRISLGEKWGIGLFPWYGVTFLADHIDNITYTLQGFANETIRGFEMLTNTQRSHRLTLLKHDMALDYILARQGGLCVALNLTGDACYTLIPDNSDNVTNVIDALKKIRDAFGPSEGAGWSANSWLQEKLGPVGAVLIQILIAVLASLCVMFCFCTLLLTFAKAMILRWVGVVMPGDQVQLPLLQRTDSDEDEEGEIDGELQEKYPF